MTVPDAVIFDYGRVLVGPLDEDAFRSDLATLAHEHNFERGIDLWNHIYISEAWEKAKRGQLTHEEFWLDRLADLGLDTPEAQHNFKMRLYRHWGFRPQMRALLDRLKRHFKLAVLSNTSRQGFRQYLVERRGLPGVFDMVISSAEVGIAKPDAAIYQLALDRLGIEPEKALFVDDLPRNTKAAEQVGLQAIVFTTPEAFQTELRRIGML